MPVPIESFAKRLVDSGLISAETLKLLLDDVPKVQRPEDGEALAKWLVQEKYLTPYQAKEIYRGRTKGLVLGNYVILDQIGAGGMGQVLKAEHQRMKRTVALKMLPEDVSEDESLIARFQREVQAAAKLMHPNIVTAFDADEADGTFFLVMEYVPGKDLASIVKEHGPLPIEQAISCILDAARGLEYAHAHSVIHRDIKPANLLLMASGGRQSPDASSGSDDSKSDLRSTHRGTSPVKILDMGLARIEDAAAEVATQAELTGTGMVMGTIDYMAPEQALNTKNADHRSDIYSLGITLYYLLTGRPAYPGESVMERLVGHREDPIPSLRAVRSTAPETLDELFAKMVAKLPEDRCQSMTEVVQAIEAIQSGSAARLPADETAFAPTDTGDSALQSFLRAMESGTATQPEVSPGPTHVATDDEATISETAISRSEGETATNINQSVTQPFTRRRSRQPKWLWPSIIGGGLLALTVLLIPLIRGPDVPAPKASPIPVATEAPPRPAEPDNSVDAERGAAWQLLRNGFELTLTDFGGTTHQVNDAVQLPDDPFVIVEALSRHRRPLQGFDLLSPQDLTPLADRPHLRKLTLHFNELTADHLDVLARIPSLDSLGLATTYPSAVTDADMARLVSSWPALSTLQTTNLRLTGEYLRALPNPTFLKIFGLGESKGGKDPGNVPHVSIDALSALAESSRLESLSLSGASLSTEGFEKIAELKSVRNLNVGGTPLSDGDVDALARLTQLEQLSLTDTSVTHQSVERLHQALPNCTIISDYGVFAPLSSSKYSGAGRHALQFDGIDDYVEIPLRGLALDGDLTIEAWVDLPVLAPPENENDKGVTVFTWNDTASIGLAQFRTLSGEGGNLTATAVGRGFWQHSYLRERPVMGWTHVAVVRHEETLRLFVNGRICHTPHATPSGTSPVVNDQFTLALGAKRQEFFPGRIDEVRVSRVARYTDDFEPVARFEADDETLMLFHCEEGSGTTLTDTSGNGYHGTIHGGAKWISPADPSPPDPTLTFDGVDDYVEIPSLKLDGFPESQPLTIEATIKVASPQVSNPVSWLGQTWIALFTRDGYFGAGRLTADGPHLIETPLGEPLDREHRVAAVWDGSRWRLFIDGRQSETTRVGFDLQPTEGGLFLGGVPLERLTGHDSPRWFAGMIDEVRISKTARYDADYTPLPRLTSDADTLALYHFDEGQGAQLRDASGSGHDGTIHGAQWVPPRTPIDE